MNIGFAIVYGDIMTEYDTSYSFVLIKYIFYEIYEVFILYLYHLHIYNIPNEEARFHLNTVKSELCTLHCSTTYVPQTWLFMATNVVNIL